MYKQTTGMDCTTCGLTRAFHHILIGNFKEATRLNGLSLQLFAFFGIQLMARIFLFFYFKKQQFYPRYFLAVDITFSIFLFIGCFFPLIAAIFN
ncbi:DUF2752 domain-containing protein [Ferruginibacter lapsinanis]|uniref:DUF2752 domain-containing protein n=1 Tax=Ferruginibacter lapsinanis TaxID=563172 RepID=UPI0021D4285B|nr:DUF2752 domain-containing protein [Ferruginibacter lapsinanis]UEG51329.1 DUF2752 domain-containing protein [Ferruginibacter lapsinanis]